MPPVSVIAHRGASAHAPEHTFEAYDLALAMGADAIELDVRDGGGELIVQHDRTRERVGRDPLALDEVLARYGRATRYWIELKDPAVAGERALVETIARHGLRERVTVQAFDRGSLRRIGRLDRALPRVALLRESLPAARARRLVALAGGGVAGVGPCAAAVDARVVDAAHGRALTVQPYTVNDATEMERLVRLGVDGIFTDAPGVLVDLLATVRTGSPGTSRWSGCRPPARAGGSASRSARTGGPSARTP